MSQPTTVIHQGSAYPSWSALGRAFGLCAATAKKRIEKNIPLDSRKTTKAESAKMARHASPWGNSDDIMFISRA